MIYFMQDGPSGHIKIGYSASPIARLAQMRVHSPNPITLLAVQGGDKAIEAALHERFAAERVRGEWFAASERLMALVNELPPFVSPARKKRTVWGDTGLSDAELAPLVGVTRSQLSRVRRGLRPPSFGVAVKLMRLTGVGVDFFATEVAENA